MTTKAQPQSTPAAVELSASATARLGRRAWMTDATRALIPLVVGIVVLGAVASFESRDFLTATNIRNILQQIAVLGVLAVGQTLLLAAGQLDLSVGSGVSLVSIVAAKLLAGGASEATVIAIAVMTGLGIGLTTGVVVAVTRVQPFILTLGLLSVLAGVGLMVSNQQPVPIGLHLKSLSVDSVAGLPVAGVVFICTCLAAGALTLFTRLGRNAYAIGSNEEAAYVAGVPTGATKIALYGLNGALVGMAGVLLLARLGSGDPNGGAGLELEAITAAVLGGATLAGGRGTVLGTFFGVLLLGMISNALDVVGVPNSYERVVFGGVLIFAVLWAAIGEMRRRSSRPLHREILAALSRLHTRQRRSP